MKIGIIDADLLGRAKHRFPNLACEKISAYWKERGATVELLLNYDNFDKYDQIYISKVFTDTPIPAWIRESEKIHVGGTGFYFDQAPNLPEEIEHHMPDYNLYNEWIEIEVERIRNIKGDAFNEKSTRAQFREYTDYSIGFLTRGCFRKCEFCVNQKYNHVVKHSSINEFYDDKKPRLCFLDDNFLGYPCWKDILQEVIDLKKPFKFKQGLDERILTDEKCKMLFSSNYDGDYTFAFDNVADYDLIKSKLEMIRQYRKSKSIKFYVLVGFESTDAVDIENAFKRIKLLMEYQCLPYIMRYQNKNYSPWKNSSYRGMYVALARWCNQPSIFKKMSFRHFCEANQALRKVDLNLCSSMQALNNFEEKYPEIAHRYFDLRFEDYK